MKRSLLICIMLIMGLNVDSFAQRKEKTENFIKETDMLPISGNMKYGYIVSEDGEIVKDGPISINCKGADKQTINGRDITYSGSYVLNANHSNGKLDGPASSDYSYDTKIVYWDYEEHSYKKRLKVILKKDSHMALLPSVLYLMVNLILNRQPITKMVNR